MLSTRIKKLLKDIIICPVAYNISDGKREVSPTRFSSTKVFFNKNNYNIFNGIADLRMPEDQKYTAYDDILPDWNTEEPYTTTEQALDADGLNKIHIKNKLVLIAGAGNGRQINLVLKLEPKLIVVIDFSNYIDTLSLKKKYKNIVFIKGDLVNLPFKCNKFDYIFSGGTIQATRSPELAHRNLWRALKRNGYLNYSHIYLENLHNRRVSIDRLKFNLHNKNKKNSRLFLKIYSYFYYILIKTRILKIVNRKLFRLPFLIELNGKANANAKYYYDGAIDYYISRYRHVIREDDVFDWFIKCGAKAIRTKKGFISKK